MAASPPATGDQGRMVPVGRQNTVNVYPFIEAEKA
jgi:hypothetical protein